MTNGGLITVCEYVEFNHSFLAAGGSAQEVAVLAPTAIQHPYVKVILRATPPAPPLCQDSCSSLAAA